VRVLTVLPDLPLPADTGLHLRMLGNLALVRALGAESHLLFFSTEDRANSLSQVDEVAELVDGWRYAGARRPQRTFTRRELLRHKTDFLVRGALRRPARHYPFSMRYDAVGGANLVAAEARAVQADVVVLPSFCLHWAPGIRATGALVIADAIDVLTDLTARLLRSNSGRRNPARMLSLLANYLASRSQERIFLPACAEVWVTSSAEAERVRGIAPGCKTVVIPNTVQDPPYTPLGDVAAPIVGFIGTYSSQPNLAAVLRLADEVLPIVRRTVPGAILRIAGAQLPADVGARLRLLPGVEVRGRVDSSADFLSECTVVALPVRVRGGVPLKLVEALAVQRAVVASPQLVEGLPLKDGRDLMVADGPDGFAEAISALLTDRVRRQDVACYGRSAFEEHFSRAALERNARAGSLLAAGRAGHAE
jgi:glycosyltransferase involved in cell wall biosynthesis